MEKVNSAAPSSFGLSSYLETQLGEKVSAETRRGAALSDWSSTLPLPEDMASFYKESDGFDLSWAQGSVSLRRLRDVKEVPIDDDFPGAAALCVQGSPAFGNVSCDEMFVRISLQ